MSEKIIADALGLRPLEDISEEEKNLPVVKTEEVLPVVPVDSLGEENLEDIEMARENIKDMIDTGNDALSDLVALAKQSQNPRAYEVVAGIMKTLLDANKEFVNMSDKRKYAKEDHGSNTKKEGNTTNVTNNNLILSTNDLLKMMKGEKP